MDYEVTKKHRTNYPNPITLLKGQPIIVGKEYTGPEKWNHWVYCSTLDRETEGWVPEQIIQIEGTVGTALEDYTAKELNVDENEKVTGLKELNGWI